MSTYDLPTDSLIPLKSEHPKGATLEEVMCPNQSFLKDLIKWAALERALLWGPPFLLKLIEQNLCNLFFSWDAHRWKNMNIILLSEKKR